MELESGALVYLVFKKKIKIGNMRKGEKNQEYTAVLMPTFTFNLLALFSWYLGNFFLPSINQCMTDLKKRIDAKDFCWVLGAVVKQIPVWHCLHDLMG